MKAQELLKKAREKGVAIGAFNVGNLETFKVRSEEHTSELQSR